MRVTIVIPVLNEAAQLADRLQALMSLRTQDVELIAVDGGSSDDTVRIAASLTDRVIVSARGRARQMNAGAAIAGGEILLFLHADTTLPDKALQLVYDGLQHDQKSWGRFDVHIAGRPRMLKLIAAMMNIRSRLSGIATGDQAMFVTRKEFVAVGGFPDQPLMEDIELSRRLKRSSRPLCLRQKVITSGRRWETHGVWRTVMLMWRLRLLYWLGTHPDKLARAYQ